MRVGVALQDESSRGQDGLAYASAMVTSTSTPGSMLMEVNCLTISEGECRSITRLWMRSWNLSHVFEPSPHGVLRVVMRSVLLGMRTGPFTFSSFSLAPRISSAHTFSREGTFFEVKGDANSVHLLLLLNSFSILE